MAAAVGTNVAPTPTSGESAPGSQQQQLINFYDEIEIEDMDYDPDEDIYTYPCPCGDRFQISKDDLRNGDFVAKCPSCSLIIKVVYDVDTL
ncbi:hypothetical protein DFJ73DRAFT_852792 [Zopfochytrium polystomum]|nr:hypothetical protein DFJ73DRAFT_852792 [Zopfochytrium polystomum]